MLTLILALLDYQIKADTTVTDADDTPSFLHPERRKFGVKRQPICQTCHQSPHLRC